MPINPEEILGLAQTVVGGVQAIAGAGRSQRLRQQRRAYQTPEEINQILQLTENLSQQGYDPATLQYLTDQTDRSYNKALGVAERLGADPNVLAGLFDQKVNDVMRIGAENHERNMANIGKYLGALDTVAANKAAEQKSQQDIIKDELQAAGANQQAGFQNIIGGINTGLAGYNYEGIKKLFTTNQTIPQLPGFSTPAYSSILPDITLPTATSPTGTLPANAATAAAGVYGGANAAGDAFLNAILNAKRGMGYAAAGLFP